MHVGNGGNAMPKFVIEREIAGAGKLPRPELQAHLTEVVQRLTGHGSENSMAAKLRYR
jgi:hypothetical protein